MKYKSSSSVILSVLVHGLVAAAVIRAGYKLALPDASVTSESVSFETIGEPANQVQSNSTGGQAPAPAQPKLVPVKEVSDVVPDDKNKGPEEETVQESAVVVPKPAPVAEEKPQAKAEEKIPENPPPVEAEKLEEKDDSKNEPKEEATENAAGEAKADAKENAKQPETAGVGDSAKPAPGEAGSANRPLDAEKLQETGGNVNPEYSRTDRLLRREGTVTLLAYIKSDGTVDLPIVKKSSGYPSLDRSAVSAYSKWHYKSGTSGYALKSFKFHIK